MAAVWVPQITDVEEPTVIDVVLEADPVLEFFIPQEEGSYPQDEGSYTVVHLADGARAICWGFGDSTPDHPHLSERIAEGLVAGDHIRLTGRWAHVRLDPTCPRTSTTTGSPAACSSSTGTS